MALPDLPEIAIIDKTVKQEWIRQEALWTEARRYFSGDIFSEEVEDTPDTLMYPVKINWCKAVVETLTHYFFGQRNIGTPKHRLFAWNVEGVDEGTADAMLAVLGKAYRRSRGDALFHTIVLDTLVDGVAFLQVNSTAKGVRLHQVSWENCKPIFPYDDPGELAGVVLHYEDLDAPYRQIWTEGYRYTPVSRGYERAVNAYGFLPFVAIRMMRTVGRFAGESTVIPLVGLQNEINVVAADTSEGLNANAHAIKWIANSNVDPTTLEHGADALWNLGTGIMGQSPVAGILTPSGNYTAAMEYLKLLVDIASILSHVPDVASGSAQGSQRSSRSMSTRMEILCNVIETWRSSFSAAVCELGEKVLRAELLWAGAFSNDPPSYTAQDIEKAEISIRLNPILRKNEQDQMDNLVAGRSAALISRRYAMRELGIEPLEEVYAEVDEELEREADRAAKGVTTQKFQHTRYTRSE